MEVFDVLTVLIFDAKVINNESEGDVTGFVFEEAVGAGLMVSVLLELFAEVIVGDFAGFLESVPGLAHFSAAASFVNVSVKVILSDDARWDFFVLVSDMLLAARGQE